MGSAQLNARTQRVDRVCRFVATFVRFLPRFLRHPLDRAAGAAATTGWTTLALRLNIIVMRQNSTRREGLSAGDGALLAQCEIDTYRSGGPGGQKRNKTSSAVRLRHRPTGLTAIAEESRSQHENKTRAIKRLRMAIALHVREPVLDGWQVPDELRRCTTSAGRLEISQRHPSYPQVVAAVLDVIDHQGGRLRESAAMVGISTSQLSRFITRDVRLVSVINSLRAARGLRPMTMAD